MTYQDLLNELRAMTDQQLLSDVCVYDSAADEYYQLGVEVVYATEQCDVLDQEHPVLRF